MSFGCCSKELKKLLNAKKFENVLHRVVLKLLLLVVDYFLTINKLKKWKHRNCTVIKKHFNGDRKQAPKLLIWTQNLSLK